MCAAGSLTLEISENGDTDEHERQYQKRYHEQGRQAAEFGHDSKALGRPCFHFRALLKYFKSGGA